MEVIKVLNVDKLIKKLNGLSKVEIERAMNKACLVVENAAKDLVPVDTGDLQRSITHVVEGNQGIIGTNKEYAPYVELGTGQWNPTGRQTPWVYKDAEGEWHYTTGQRPHPYLKPALDNNKQEVYNVLSKELKKEIDKYAEQ